MKIIKTIIHILFHKLEYTKYTTGYVGCVIIKCHKCKRSWDTIDPVGHASWHEIKYKE